MKISARERTGLRAMVEFAQRYGEGPIALPAVAQAQDLPLPYLERVVALLRESALLESVRGAHGGYYLARPPAHISVADIFRAVEGSLLSVECVGPGRVACDKEAVCAARQVFRSVAERPDETLADTTLADLLAQDAVASPGPEPGEPWPRELGA